MDEVIESAVERYEAIEREYMEYKKERHEVEEILQNELQLVGKEFETAVEEIDQIKSEIKSLKQKLSNIKVNKRNEKQIQAVTAKIEDLEKVLAGKEQYVLELKKSQEGTKNELKEHQKETKAQFNDYESQLSALKVNKGIITSNGELSDNKLKDILKEEKETIANLKEKHKKEMSKIHGEYENEKKKILSENDKLKSEIIKVQNAFDLQKSRKTADENNMKAQMSESKNIFTSEKKQLELANEKLKSEITEARKDFEIEKKRLTDENNKLKENIRKVTKDFESERKKLQEEIEKIRLDLNQAQNNLENEKKKIQSENNRLNACDNKESETKEQLQLKDYQIKKLTNTLKSVQAELLFETQKTAGRRIDIKKVAAQLDLLKLILQMKNQKSSKSEEPTTKNLESTAANSEADGNPPSRVEPDSSTHGDQDYSDNLQRLLHKGLNKEIVAKLGQIYKAGKLSPSDLDDWALDSLKKYPPDATIEVLTAFLNSKLDVSLIYDRLCNYMNKYREKTEGKSPATAERVTIEEILLTPSISGPREDQFRTPTKRGSMKCRTPSKSSLKEGTLKSFIKLPTPSKNTPKRLLTPSKNSPKEEKPSASKNGPDELKIQELLKRTGYELNLTSKYRQYGGPPPDWRGGPRDLANEIKVTNIPADMYEDELVPMFRKYGKIYSLRLMMNPDTRQHTGEAIVNFFGRFAAERAFREMSNKGDENKIEVSLVVPCCRLLLGNIPLDKPQDQINYVLRKLTAGLENVVFFDPDDPDAISRKFCVLLYDSYLSTYKAKQRIQHPAFNLWNKPVVVDWFNSELDRSPDRSKERVLCISNVPREVSTRGLLKSFECFGDIEDIKKGNQVAFVIYKSREDALKAYEVADRSSFCGSILKVNVVLPKWEQKENAEFLHRRLARMRTLLEKLEPRRSRSTSPVTESTLKRKRSRSPSRSRSAIGRRKLEDERGSINKKRLIVWSDDSF